ncbi:MAG: hypothetical protein AAF682_25075 [Planctomycetota bacterium]
MQTAPRPHRSQEADDALSEALLDGLNVPLSALRASLESLAAGLPREDPRSGTIAGALAEVSKVGRSVQDLAAYAAPPHPRPLRCTVEEIVYSARHQLPKKDRERVLIARVDRGGTLFVDGPLLARCLHRLVENAVEASTGYVLMNVREDDDATLFTTVNRDLHTQLDLEWAQAPFQTDKPRHLGLGLALAKRDIELLGGTLVLTRTPRGETVAMARVPNAPEADRP